MKYIIFLVVVLLMFTYMFGFFNNDKINVDDKSSSIYSYSIDVIDGETISLNDFKGKKILFVNVASKCGYTPQYKQLQSLYEKYNDELMIVGFPANDFMWQEPGKNNQIKTFCSTTYGVTFPIVEKTTVKKKESQHPVYTWLSHKSLNGWNDSAPSWNFYKYLIDEKGQLLDVFSSKVNPLDDKIISYFSK